MVLFFVWLAVLLAAGVAILGLVLGFVYVPHVVRVSQETTWLAAELPQNIVDEGESCAFFAGDGLKLAGTYLPTPAVERRGLVIFCHELTGNRWSAVEYLDDLRQQGFDIFTFDFRNHGQSASLPGYEPLPWLTSYELDDLCSAINYVCGRFDVEQHGVGLLGVSRGGTAALCAAALDGRVRAVVTDGAFSFEAIQLHYLRRYMHIFSEYGHLFDKLPNRALVGLCKWGQWIIARRRHCRFVNVEQTVRLIRRPVLLIHGADDSIVPLEVVESLRRCLVTRSRLWVVPRARHNAAIESAPAEYHRRLTRFFARHLAANRYPVETGAVAGDDLGGRVERGVAQAAHS